MTLQPKKCRLCSEPATVTRTFIVRHNGVTVTHSTCEKHDGAIRTGMLETGWEEVAAYSTHYLTRAEQTRECAAATCDRLIPSWMPFCYKHMRPWRCETHNLATTGDCPRCDDELIALAEDESTTEPSHLLKSFRVVLDEHVEDLAAPGACSCGWELWDGTVEECRAAYRGHVDAHLRVAAEAAAEFGARVRSRVMAELEEGK